MSELNKDTNLAGAFQESVGTASTPPRDKNTIDESSISATARAELDNAASCKEALDAHEERWRVERGKIANASDPYPDFDLGSRAHRNIQSEYEERRTVWELERDRIERSFAAKREDIRGASPTLTGDFARNGRDGKSASENDFSFPAPSKDDQTLGHAFEAGQDKGRTL